MKNVWMLRNNRLRCVVIILVPIIPLIQIQMRIITATGSRFNCLILFVSQKWWCVGDGGDPNLATVRYLVHPMVLNGIPLDQL